jgi:hypothetical protein
VAEWRFPCFDLRTSAFVGMLPAIESAWSDVLNDQGAWSVSAQLTEQSYGMARDYTGRLLVIAERGGLPVGSGILWRSSVAISARTVEFAGAGLMSFYEHFTIIDAATYTGVDQFDIFRQLAALQVTQSTAGDIDIHVEATASGVTRDRTYEAYSGKTFQALMTELAAVLDGFDWAARVEYNEGVPERWLRTWYPRRGRTQSVTGLRFNAPSRQVDVGSISFDASEMATTIVASGSTPTPTPGDPIAQDTLRTTASRTDLVAAGWPGYSLNRIWPDVTELVTLDEHAEAEVVRLSQVERENYTVLIDPDSTSQPWGAWELGDEALLTISDPVLGEIVATRRVVGHAWSVGAGGEQLSVTLAPVTEAPYVPVEIRHAPPRVVVAPAPTFPNESQPLIPPKTLGSISGPASATAPAVQIAPAYAPARRG